MTETIALDTTVANGPLGWVQRMFHMTRGGALALLWATLANWIALGLIVYLIVLQNSLSEARGIQEGLSHNAAVAWNQRIDLSPVCQTPAGAKTAACTRR